MQLHADLATLAREGVDHLALEASSHGLDQYRLDGLRLSAAAFTNLTHDHLDYHPTMDAYFAAKARLFDSLLPAGGTAVVNADSDRAAALAAICRAPRPALLDLRPRRAQDFRLLRDEPTPDGQHLVDRGFSARAHEVELPLVGGFQAANALAALGLVLATGGDRRARRGGAGEPERRAGPAAACGAPSRRARRSMSTMPTSPTRWRRCSRRCGRTPRAGWSWCSAAAAIATAASGR